MVSERVVVLANDVTPGLGLPAAAPGLRAFGLADGLRSHGFDVATVVPASLLSGLWANSSAPPPLQPGTIALDPDDLAGYLDTRQPATVVMTNSNLVEWLQRMPGLRYVYDFFAPKMLELANEHGGEHPGEAMARLRERKIAALSLADGIAVNGPKKRAYALAWALQTDHDPRSLPVEVVNMAVPGRDHVDRDDRTLRFAIAGYLQRWSVPGPWLQVLGEHVARRRNCTLEVVLQPHWGLPVPTGEVPHLDELVGMPGVTAHPAMRFSELQGLLSEVDVAVDLFDRNLEREYAMVTRTVVALACGVPVVHPPFTEVSPFIRDYDAGWLHAADDLQGLPDLLRSITPRAATLKSANARRLWADVFEPHRATAPLTRLIEAVWAS